MMVVYTSTIEAMSAVPNETRIKYAPTSWKQATKQLISAQLLVTNDTNYTSPVLLIPWLSSPLARLAS
jgi:hypothetical protein